MSEAICPNCGTVLKDQEVQVVRSTGIVILGVQLFCPNMDCKFETDEKGVAL